MTDPSGQQAGSPAELLGSGAAAGMWRLDAAQSEVSFSVKHFWGAITVHGSFSQFSGEGEVATDGTVTGGLVIEAASVTTKHNKRDEHLRSDDFFDVNHHPQLVVLVTGATLDGPASRECPATLEAAGHTEPIEFTGHLDDVSAQAVTVRAALTVDRTRFGMTWSPLRMASRTATATVVARFVRV